ncbi:MAG: efflux RND transporter permease subunit [Magnetococcales bacterium]|nr:efflux RND transporter permease subunit [Magnetococcales bacterium]
MNVSAWSIRNPIPALLLFLLLTLFGLASFRSLGIQNFPDIELPIIVVNAALEGAAPDQLEAEVARKIEDKLATLGGVEHIRTAITDGSALINIEFQIDKDVEVALSEVRNAVDSVRADLPADMTDPMVSKVTTSGTPILTFAVQSQQLDESDLSWFVDNEVTRALLAVSGVGKVARVGGVDREIHINLDPVAMTGLRVTATDLSRRLKGVQQQNSGGRTDIGGAQQSIRLLGTVDSAAALAAIDIPLADGRSVRLDQVARIEDRFADRTAYALLNGQPVVGFEISRTKGVSEVAVADRVRLAVTQLQQRYPQVQLTEAFNTVDAVMDNYSGSMHLLYEGALLAVLVVWWFLRDWRATLVSATALPLSILPTFLAMYYAGFTLNTLTLLALALVVGILVDDAIVEIENIMRHLRMGKSPYQAAMEAADEIGLAVIGTTLTLVAVFLPTAFMGGVPGKFFKSFGITAAVAVLASLLVARMLTPMMAAYFLREQGAQGSDTPLMSRYLVAVRWCLGHRHTTLVAALLFFAGSVALIPLLPTGFLPVADRSQTSVRIELQPGTPIETTRAVAEQARSILQQMPDVRQVFTAVGSSAGGGPFNVGGSTDVRKATLSVLLTHRSDRSYKQTAIEADMRTRLQQIAGARLAVGMGHAGEKLQVVLASDDPVALQAAVQAVEPALRTIRQIGNISSGATLQRPEIHITPNFVAAAELGVTTQSMAEMVRIATGGDFRMALPKLNLPQRQIPIRVRLDAVVRRDLNTIGQLRLAGRAGPVTLASVATIRLTSGPSQIERLDRMRNITFDIELGTRLLGDVLSEVNQLPTMQSLPPSVKRPISGDAERMHDLFSQFGSAMLVGVICIYVVLVMLFHDFLQPVTILAALPLSLGGAFMAMLLTGSSFSMPSVIGVLMLMGIVTKNSILLVEYSVVARRDRGLARLDALVDACHKRAQPILMTTIAMAAGMLPVAMGLGAEPSFRAPMAIVVIGGVLTSTFLSLLVIPVIFTYIDDGLQVVIKVTSKMARKA